MAVRSARESQARGTPDRRSARSPWWLLSALFAGSAAVVFLGVAVWTRADPPVAEAEDLRGAKDPAAPEVVFGSATERRSPAWEASPSAPSGRSAPRAEPEPSRPSTLGSRRRAAPGPAVGWGSDWSPGLSPKHCILYFQGRSRAGTSGTYWCRAARDPDELDSALRRSFERTFRTLADGVRVGRMEGPGARATWSHHRGGWMRITLYQQSGDAAERLLFSAGLGLISELP